MKAWDASIWATVGVAGACCAALVLAAGVRLDQKLRKAGRYSSPKGARAGSCWAAPAPCRSLLPPLLASVADPT